MKRFLFVALILVLGACLGAGIAVLRVRATPWHSTTDETAETAPTPDLPPDGPMPKVVVDAEEYDFGNVDVEQSGGNHEFTFTNEGDAPLSLTEAGTSCRCTMSKLENDQIPPGGSTKVMITWKPISVPGPYQQTTRIRTNDPAKPVIMLKVFGHVTAAFRFSPPELVFTRLSAGESSTGKSKLYCYLDEAPKILGHTWGDESTTPFFDVEMTPMSEEEVKNEPLAKSGTDVTVTVKPGLPQGPISQKLILQTDASAAPTLSIEGVIGSEIAVVGPGWNADKNILSLGEVPRSKGIKWRLLLLVRGPMRNEIEFKPTDVTPEMLHVSLGKRTEINNGVVVQMPLLIEIPPNSPPANHLGSEQGRMGEIILETTHPHVPKLRIYVRFAIEG